MLQIQHIRKQYTTGDLIQTALDDVSLNFRDNEFVAILGPSGSGKTTMLNIIGGLDRYDSGDLIINGISTKQYKDKDWDSYRNHTIGFVFQSYNLIPHQTVLSNVELALTISGVSKSERRKRAKSALEKVGLGNQLHKKPNQMSGGQMQRVAIARALVNNPAILLADEPTGALDSETSIQVMDMLKEVAKDRLVIMVTHNPELAEEYANRIVRVKDGKILEDSNPFDSKNLSQEASYKNMGKSSMSMLTALELSFNNLKTKKGRTLLTSFAGSIGIIGIALILSLSNGVNTYIEDLQKDTMTAYPISIEAQSMDMSSLIEMGQSQHSKDKEINHNLDAVYGDSSTIEVASTMQTSIKENNLTAFKEYLDNQNSEIHKYIGENGIVYSYDTKFSVYTYDDDNKLINTDGSTLQKNNNQYNFMDMMMQRNSMLTGSNLPFEELMPSADNSSLVSKTITDNYELVYGSMPNAYNELVLVLDENNEILQTLLYQLGFLPTEEYQEIVKLLDSGETITINSKKISYTDICNKDFYLIPNCDFYQENQENHQFDRIQENSTELEELLENAVKLKITGIIRPNEDLDNTLIYQPIGYTSALTEYLINYTQKSDIVKAQEENPDKNILTGLHFEAKKQDEKIEDVKNYISDMGISEKASMYQTILMLEQISGKSSDSENSEKDTEFTTEQTTDIIKNNPLAHANSSFSG
ncbi:MAG: ABC transporter ATP-binding protein, partial [Ruminococcus sp.]|nr:ABC transporter ATP-binding protein [Ruminococcus sp.]